MSTRTQVFVSYAHLDVKWRDMFIKMFAPAVDRGSISVWSDEDIAVGKDWSKSIEHALASSCAGLLLVTPNFLSSEFITHIELQRLLALASTAGVAIYWAPITPSLWEQSPLSAIKATWDPKVSLDEMPVPAQEKAVHQLCLQIVEDFGFLPKVTDGRRQTLPAQLQSRLGDEYELVEEVGTGKSSIFYRARQRNPTRTVGVKLFVAPEFDDWAWRKFKDAVERAAELTSPAFIKIIEYSMEQRPEFLVTEFVRGESLNKYLLRHPGGAPLESVQRILLDLVQAVEEIHDRESLRGEVCSSDIFIESSGAARLSAVDYSSVVTDESQMAGNFLIDRESLAYMTPERFFGDPPTRLTDQYSLGLIAMELLGGERMARVSSPSDLRRKPRLFRGLERATGNWARRSPAFAGLVSKMLRVNPNRRWPSMHEVHVILRNIEIAESDADVCRRAAVGSYVQLQKGGGERALFARFYQNLFTACPEVRARFSINMERQYEILNDAIWHLLDFDPAKGSEPLRAIATQHARFGLTRRHYDLFLEGLLAALKQSGVHDPGKLAAWRRTLTPAIDFMCCCQSTSTTPANVVSVGA